jgi:ankyrin repeat protein
MTDEQLASRVIAAAFESPDAMFDLVRTEPHLLEARTGLGETPLHYLAVENQLRAVLLLAEAGATVNTVSFVGGMPLSEAASLGYAEMVEYLLARGASLWLPGQNEPTLHEAVKNGDARIVKMLLGAGAPIDEQNDLNETALHLAAESEDRLGALEVLIGSGADLSVHAAFDETPLDVALREGCDTCAKALAAAGAPRNRVSAA